MDRDVAGLRFPLPARDRILLHLSDFAPPSADEGSFPPALTQDGIAGRTGLGRAHVALALKSLREEGFVEELKGRIAGEARRRKVYTLSAPGRDHSRRLISVIMEQEISIFQGGTSKRARLSEASFLLQKKIPLVELALAVGEGATLNVGPDGMPVLMREEEPAAPSGEALEEEASEPAAGPPPARPDSAPESLFEEPSEGPQNVPLSPTPAPAGTGPSTPAPSAPIPITSTPLPPSPLPPSPLPPSPFVSPWVRIGQLAAVWAAALVLAGVFVWLSYALDEPLPAEFLVMYFIFMVTLQVVLLAMDTIPPNVRAEMGLFIGGFLSLYGGFLAFGPPFQSTLWFAEGVLLVCTGLLTHPLDGNRRFQTLGAGAGAFTILLCLRLLFTLQTTLLVPFLLCWMLVGALLMAARLFPEELDYTAHLRTAGGLSAGCFIMAIGAFLLLKGFFAESFIELFVGGIIIFYMIPKTRQDWSIRLVATTMILSITVVITTLLALFVLLENLPHILGN